MKQITVFKVGEQGRPASKEDIDDVRDAIKKCLSETEKGLEGLNFLITHHAVTIEQAIIQEDSDFEVKGNL